MTPQEKAKELVDKYIEWTQEWSEIDGYIIDMYNAKQCALIAVDLVIENIEDDYMHYELDYWNEVKQEIEKI